MKGPVRLGILAVLAVSPVLLAAQSPGSQTFPQPDPTPPAVDAAASAPVNLNWAPPALAALSAQAAVQNSFTFDRTMLIAAAGLLPDSDADVKQTVDKLEGLSVHLLRFGPEGIPDPSAVEALRSAYHQAGWKHLVADSPAPAAPHDESTDVWLLVDGVNMRGAVVLEETPRSLTLVTVAGNLNPVDLLHLRGHFGIPRFSGDALNAPTRQ